MSDIADRIREFIMRATRLREFADDQDLLETGLVNSLLLAQLLSFVENDLGVVLDDDDLHAGNFRTVTAIAGLVESKGTSRAVR